MHQSLMLVKYIILRVKVSVNSFLSTGEEEVEKCCSSKGRVDGVVWPFQPVEEVEKRSSKGRVVSA